MNNVPRTSIATEPPAGKYVGGVRQPTSTSAAQTYIHDRMDSHHQSIKPGPPGRATHLDSKGSEILREAQEKEKSTEAAAGLGGGGDNDDNDDDGEEDFGVGGEPRMEGEGKYGVIGKSKKDGDGDGEGEGEGEGKKKD